MPRTIAELRKELAAKERQFSKLQAQRQKITKQLAALDRELAALGGGPVRSTRKAKKAAGKKIRPWKAQPSLADVLAEVLVGKANVKVAEAAKLAVAAGYKSVSSQFGNIVSQTLSADRRFKKISRGVYVLKNGRKASVKKSGKKVARKAAIKASRMAVRKVERGARKPLAQCLAEALGAAGTPMRAMDLADAVRKAGYSTQDRNFKQTVARALAIDKRFERVDRGVYKLA